MYADEFTPLKSFIDQIINVTEQEWKAHRNCLTRRFLKKGEFLIREGQVSNHVSFVNKGSFRMYHEINGQEITKHFFFECGYAADYVSFLGRKPSLDYIKAFEDTELIELHYENVQELYEKFPVWQKYGRLIAEGLFIQFCERTEQLLYLTPEENYLKIMEQCPAHHRKGSATIYRCLPGHSARIAEQNKKKINGITQGLNVF